MKYGQRWYKAGTGRWTQMDTLDAPLDPANANRYAYAANDPINNSDPLGLIVASAELEFCLFICGSAGFGADDGGGTGFSLGLGAGGKGGLNLNIGLSSGDVTQGWAVTGGCDAAFGAGLYAAGSIDQSQSIDGGGGASFGLGAGCSAIIGYTF